jgi:DEAD/DEAH box helicase domain-containing protein
MKFKDFFQNIERRTTDAVLSLWATGDAETQQYFKHIFEKEKLLAEPVFQTAFPWEAADRNFGSLSDFFPSDFINALDGIKNEEYRFPKERSPYKHQIESWKVLLQEKKSIVVTTGTGSGKTECFMIPVLSDLYENCQFEEGISAIFLYPLNALIGSQKKRMDAWTKSLKNKKGFPLKYAVYNGKTDENHNAKDQENAYPEIISRDQIRKHPPQILFTNPTMLEYILVRNKDVSLLENSKGKLRWILLDEAHTLTGSTAAEMALLIRRVLEAFEVEAKDVRFAATSATVGDGNDDRLLEFMSNLSGQDKSKIKIIKGERIIPTIPASTKTSFPDSHEILNGNNLSEFKAIHDLRREILHKTALELTEITDYLKLKNEDWTKGLEIIDKLSEKVINDKALLPLRGHFFLRSIGGVYTCTNSECDKHGVEKPKSALGTLTTFAAPECDHCAHPMLELVACRSCGNQLLMGEKIKGSSFNEYVKPCSNNEHEAFSVENDEDEAEENETEEQQNVINSENILLAKYSSENRYSDSDQLKFIGLNKESKIIDKETYITFENMDCPHCNENNPEPLHFRISSSFLNRVLSDIILEETPEAKPIDKKMLWRGHKYISFTDSRQGTAKVSALINLDTEKTWLWSNIYHELCNKRTCNYSPLTSNEIEDLKNRISYYKAKLSQPLLNTYELEDTEKSLKDSEKKLQSTLIPAVTDSRISWEKMFETIEKKKTEIDILYHNLKPNGTDQKNYLKSLFYNNLSRRLPRERSLENLGLISLVYPKIETNYLPEIATDLGISKDEWDSLLKISIDYILRYRFHFSFPHAIWEYRTIPLRSVKIYPKDSDIIKTLKWPKYNRKETRPNRLCLLICAGLGIHELHNDKILEDKINFLLDEIWKILSSNILKRDGEGFILDLEEQAAFQLTEKVWLCPVKKRLIDANFKGFSPWITGRLALENINHFKLKEDIVFPYFPYPYNLNNNQEASVLTMNWIEEKCNHLKDAGVWNDLHERIILNRPIFLAGEHSAQQLDTKLKKLEDKFSQGELNILSCSTTMEMGVDIGNISVVVMNNVPPSSANYLQRAGRAGRRSETKALALTFCAPTPIGAYAMENPMWALKHKMAGPSLAFNSRPLAERHINAYFLGKFIRKSGGINVSEKLEDFFFNGQNGAKPFIEEFISWLDHLITKCGDGDILSEINPGLIKLKQNTPLKDFSTLQLIFITKANAERIKEKTETKKLNYETNLQQKSSDFGVDSPAYRAVNRQFMIFLKEPVIGYLGEEGFIPSAGMPTGVVSFETAAVSDIITKQGKKVFKNESEIPNPSFHILRALTEYAPGNNIVIDGWSYRSSGILMSNDNQNQSRRNIIQSCRSCGYQRILETEQNIKDECPECKNHALRGLNFTGNETPPVFTEMIEPAGFAVDFYSVPDRQISERSNAQFVKPLLLGVDHWPSDSQTAIYDIRYSVENAEILYYNMGKGKGYAVCLHCGKTEFSRDDLADHARLRGGKKDDQNKDNTCTGNHTNGAIKENVILGGRFHTDFCEIRFRKEDLKYSNDESLIYSLGVILTKVFCSYLGVEESELSFGVKQYREYCSIFIFDTAKGGAGYAVKFTDYAEEIFEEAYIKLKDCSCKKACTKCLIDRNSQWFMQKLDRYKAKEWLQRAVNNTVPEQFKALYPNLKTVTGSVQEDILRHENRKMIQKIWLYVDSKVSNWQLDNAPFFNALKKNNTDNKINFVFGSELDCSAEGSQITAIQVSDWAKYWKDSSSHKLLKPTCRIDLLDGKSYTYYADDFYNDFGIKWAVATNGISYKNETAVPADFKEINLGIPQNNNQFEIRLKPDFNFNSNELSKVFLDKVKEQKDLAPLMIGQKFKVVYCDRYLKSPFSCLLLVQFIKGLSKELNFTVEFLKVKLEDFTQGQYPYRIFHNYYDGEDRNSELGKLAGNLLNLEPDFEVGNLPHYRYFIFYNDSIKITIRPDGGIEHGWESMGNTNYSQLSGREKILMKLKESHPILYTIIIEKR